MTAKFIVIEGLEGAGKSTAIAVCQAYLQHKQVEFINVREPGGTPVAEALRHIVKQAHEEQITGETELLIMYAARSQLVANVIKPAIDKGTWVLGDRHDLSSQAYQGGGRGIEQSKLSFLADMVLKGLKPDLTIYLDIDPAVGLARAKGRGNLIELNKKRSAFLNVHVSVIWHLLNMIPVFKLLTQIKRCLKCMLPSPRYLIPFLRV